MRAVVVGLGAVGGRVVQVLAGSDAVESLVVLHRDPRRAAGILLARGLEEVEVRRVGHGRPPAADVTVLAAPGVVRRHAEAAVRQGSHVVAVTDDPTEIRGLVALDDLARAEGLSVVAGAAMAPGLSCVLAAHLHHTLDRVDEIHVARAGTGGPACARRHHAALTATGVDWDDREWRRRGGGSGRELVWFPEPVGGADCYRAGLADPLLLVAAFPGCRRVTSRLAATRRDRVTSRLPMLRPPHPEGLIGAVRVEVRGWVGDRAETRMLGVSSPPAAVAAAVAAQTVGWAGTGRLFRAGAGGLAEMVATPAAFLRELAKLGVTVATFEGGHLEG